MINVVNRLYSSQILAQEKAVEDRLLANINQLKTLTLLAPEFEAKPDLQVLQQKLTTVFKVVSPKKAPETLAALEERFGDQPSYEKTVAFIDQGARQLLLKVDKNALYFSLAVYKKNKRYMLLGVCLIILAILVASFVNPTALLGLPLGLIIFSTRGFSNLIDYEGARLAKALNKETLKPFFNHLVCAVAPKALADLKQSYQDLGDQLLKIEEMPLFVFLKKIEATLNQNEFDQALDLLNELKQDELDPKIKESFTPFFNQLQADLLSRIRVSEKEKAIRKCFELDQPFPSDLLATLPPALAIELELLPQGDQRALNQLLEAAQLSDGKVYDQSTKEALEKIKQFLVEIRSFVQTSELDEALREKEALKEFVSQLPNELKQPLSTYLASLELKKEGANLFLKRSLPSILKQSNSILPQKVRDFANQLRSKYAADLLNSESLDAPLFDREFLFATDQTALFERKKELLALKQAVLSSYQNQECAYGFQLLRRGFPVKLQNLETALNANLQVLVPPALG